MISFTLLNTWCMRKIILILVVLTFALCQQSNAQFDKNQKKSKTIPEKSDTPKNTEDAKVSEEVSGQKDTEEKKGFDPKKLVISPIIGLSFNPLVVQIAPKVGYRFKKNLIGGVSINYLYYKDKSIDPTGLSSTVSRRLIGGGLFGSYAVTEFLFGAVDLEMNTYKSKLRSLNQNLDNPLEIYPSFLVGGGINMGGLYFKAQYDVLQKNPAYLGRAVTSFGYFF
jgi:hypothetical protein